MLSHVIAGRLNKQIAADLGTVEKTIKVHRGRMMQKMGVHSVADQQDTRRRPPCRTRRRSSTTSTAQPAPTPTLFDCGMMKA